MTIKFFTFLFYTSKRIYFGRKYSLEKYSSYYYIYSKVYAGYLKRNNETPTSIQICIGVDNVALIVMDYITPILHPTHITSYYILLILHPYYILLILHPQYILLILHSQYIHITSYYILLISHPYYILLISHPYYILLILHPYYILLILHPQYILLILPFTVFEEQFLAQRFCKL